MTSYAAISPGDLQLPTFGLLRSVVCSSFKHMHTVFLTILGSPFTDLLFLQIFFNVCVILHAFIIVIIFFLTPCRVSCTECVHMIFY